MRKPLFKSRDKNTQGMNVMQGFAAQISDRLNQQAQPKVMALEKRMVAGIPGSMKLTNKETEDEDVNLTLDHDSNQWKVLPSAPDEDKRKVIKFVKEQFDLAYRARREMELEWAMAIAFFEGRQWFTISSQTRNLITSKILMRQIATLRLIKCVH